MKSESIKEFLNCKKIAVIGVSSKGKGMGIVVYNHLKDCGTNVFAINKNGGNFKGIKLYSSIKDISENIDGIITIVPPAETEKVVKEALELGVNNIWMQQGSESNIAIKFCEENGISLIYGECILMFSEPVKSIHGFHRWINKIIGKYPKQFNIN